MSELKGITRIRLTPEKKEWLNKIFEERDKAALRKQTKEKGA